MQFTEFLNQAGIEVGGCAVYQATDGNYYLVTKVNTSTGELYLINNHFFYDYTTKWQDTSPWNLIYLKPE